MARTGAPTMLERLQQAGEPEAAQEVVHAEGRDEGGCGVEMK